LLVGGERKMFGELAVARVEARGSVRGSQPLDIFLSLAKQDDLVLSLDGRVDRLTSELLAQPLGRIPIRMSFSCMYRKTLRMVPSRSNCS
jgi:hypothetical protein